MTRRDERGGQKRKTRDARSRSVGKKRELETLGQCARVQNEEGGLRLFPSRGMYECAVWYFGGRGGGCRRDGQRESKKEAVKRPVKERRRHRADRREKGELKKGIMRPVDINRA